MSGFADAWANKRSSSPLALITANPSLLKRRFKLRRLSHPPPPTTSTFGRSPSIEDRVCPARSPNSNRPPTSNTDLTKSLRLCNLRRHVSAYHPTVVPGPHVNGVLACFRSLKESKRREE